MLLKREEKVAGRGTGRAFAMAFSGGSKREAEKGLLTIYFINSAGCMKCILLSISADGTK